jgi:cold shock protein
MKGRVKWFDANKGYGFIISEDGQEVFVHHKDIIQEGFKTLEDDQEVTFEKVQGDRGPQAFKVQVVE